MKYIFIIAALVCSIQTGFAANCSTIWANGFPDVIPRTTPVACDEFFPIHTTMDSNQKLFTISSLTHNPAIKDEMEVIASALSYSSGKYASYGRVPAITVIRQDIAHPNGDGASAMAFTYVQFFNLNTESCPIFVYPVSEVLSKEHLQQLIAHEVFHCVQKANFKNQVTYAANTSDQAFWFEGLAQVFSNFVYPNNDFEYTSRFPAPDQTLPFYAQENAYSSENFWQSYSNLLSENALFRMMTQMPTAAGEIPATTVANLPRISEALHNYAQKITLKKVRDSSGAMSPYDMPFEQKAVADIAHQEINLFHVDMTVGAYMIKIPKAGKWTLRFTHPANTKISLKKPEEAEYSPVTGPVVITSACDSERYVQIVITTTSDQEAINTTNLIVDKNSNPDCDCFGNSSSAPPMIDQCLIGSWNLDHASVAQFWNRLNNNPRVRFNGSTGGFRVNFNEAGVGTWLANNWNIAAQGDMDHGMIMSLERITNGSSTFKYSANGSMACSQQTSSNLNAKVIITIDGQVVSTTEEPPMDFSKGVFTYSCTNTQFIFKYFTVDGMTMDIEYVFNRL